jgi:hypothetical protein
MLGLWALVLFLGLLGVGTINNQLRINRANEILAAQARAGQQSLDRTCRLIPISKKIYVDALERDVITPRDYDVVVSSASQICPPPPKPTDVVEP